MELRNSTNPKTQVMGNISMISRRIFQKRLRTSMEIHIKETRTAVE